MQQGLPSLTFDRMDHTNTQPAAPNISNNTDAGKGTVTTRRWYWSRGGRFRTVACLVVLATLALPSTEKSATRSAEPQAALPETTLAEPARFVPVAPVRVLDTRVLHNTLRAAGEVVLPLSELVPSRATAVTVTVTVTNATGNGFLTVWPTGSPRPVVSSINTTYFGQTTSNTVTSSLGANHSLSIYSQTGSDVVVDLAGWYEPSGVTTSGRFIPVQARVLDTRVNGNPLKGAGHVSIDLTSIPDLFGPQELITGASAVALNLTAVDAPVGFWTLYPSGRERPLASHLNVDVSNRVTASMAVVAIDDARLELFSQNGGHVVVDVLGFFTGESAPEASEGLFVAVAPMRLSDSRRGTRLAPRSSVDIDLDQLLAPTKYRSHMIEAIDTNVTVTETTAPGYFTVYPGRYPVVPDTSNLNAPQGGWTGANHVIAPTTEGGLSVYTQNGGHVLVDITGLYLGEPVMCWSCIPTRAPVVGTRSDWYAPTPTSIGIAWTPLAPTWVAGDGAIYRLPDGILIVALYDGTWRAFFIAGATSYTIDETTIWNHVIRIACEDEQAALHAVIDTDYTEDFHPYYQSWLPMEQPASC